MTDHVLTRAKAYAALLGSVLTVVISQVPSDPTTQKWLGIALALCTAVATFAVPNKPTAAHRGQGGAVDVILLLCVAILVVVLLLFFRVHA